jgi:GNAT superfamily N-acetyltransferase
MDPSLTLRAATPADLAAVDALLARSYPRLLAPDYPPSVLVTALPLISRARPELLASGTYYVVEDGAGDILGAGGWSRGAAAGGAVTGRVGHVRHLVTDHRALRRGIARSIMAATFAAARKAGCTALDCLSTRTAVPFYAAVGFQTLGPVTVALRPGIEFPAVRMARAL